ncbi:retrotransposon unclassified [Hordeum vulgare]|nr:retrotransposon unclassified [Hordeum vulgare]
MEVMEARERLPKETKGKTKKETQAWDEAQSAFNKEEVEEVDFLQPYLHLLSPSLIELLRFFETTRACNTYLTREVVLLEKHITDLQEWNKALHQGPWDFKGMALIIAEYDGFKNPESVKLDKIETWCQIHRLPDMVQKRELFLGHWHEECGSREHDKNDMKWVSFILASLRGAGGSRNSVRVIGRGLGRGSGAGDEDDEAANGERRGDLAGTRGRGCGHLRDFEARDPLINTIDAEHLHTSWCFNATNALFDPGAGVHSDLDSSPQEMRDDARIVRKRGPDDSHTVPKPVVEEDVQLAEGGIVPAGITANRVEQFEGSDPPSNLEIGTPQKNANR